MNDLEPLWKIEEELETLLDTLDVCEPELRPELEARIAAYVGAEIQKIDNIASVLASLEHVEHNAQAEIERLRARQQAAQRAAERLKAYLLRVLRQRDGRPLKGTNVTLSVRRTEALTIIAPELVPEKFKRTTIVVDVPKTPIREALKAGEEVPGVVLEVHEHLVKK